MSFPWKSASRHDTQLGLPENLAKLFNLGFMTRPLDLRIALLETIRWAKCYPARPMCSLWPRLTSTPSLTFMERLRRTPEHERHYRGGGRSRAEVVIHP